MVRILGCCVFFCCTMLYHVVNRRWWFVVLFRLLGNGGWDCLQSKRIWGEWKTQPVATSQGSGASAGSWTDAAVWPDDEGCHRLLLSASTHSFSSCPCSGINFILNIKLLLTQILMKIVFYRSFRHCVRAVDCMNLVLNTWNSFAKCPYQANRAEMVPLWPACPAKAKDKHPTHLNLIQKNLLQWWTRTESPTAHSVQTATKAQVSVFLCLQLDNFFYRRFGQWF